MLISVFSHNVRRIVVECMIKLVVFLELFSIIFISVIGFGREFIEFFWNTAISDILIAYILKIHFITWFSLMCISFIVSDLYGTPLMWWADERVNVSFQTVQF